MNMQTGYCGICGLHDANRLWHHPDGQFAHGPCVEKFDKIEALLQRALKHLFPDDQIVHRQKAHAVAISKVSEKIQSEHSVGCRTLLFYLESYKEELLTNYFNTVGIDAAIEQAKIVKSATIEAHAKL